MANRNSKERGELMFEMFFSKKKTRKTLAKHDAQQASEVLDFINHTAIRTASMGAEYKKRAILEGSSEDVTKMEVCDNVTIQLKGAYETMYEILKEGTKGAESEKAI